MRFRGSRIRDTSRNMSAPQWPCGTPLRPDLWVLDWDREYRQYRRRFAGDPLYDPGPLPDFHPRLSHFCTLDHDVVEPLVENLIQRIESSPNPGVAFDMARWFIGFYRDDGFRRWNGARCRSAAARSGSDRRRDRRTRAPP